MIQILEKLRKVFKINTSSEWGNTWHDFEKRRIVGHDGQPEKGDVFTCKMQSGKIAVFEVVEVEWCGDPRNMYFCTVKDVGYWEPVVQQY